MLNTLDHLYKNILMLVLKSSLIKRLEPIKKT